MVDLNIKLPEGFLDEEERCGYTVSRKMKEVWAVQLDMLNELKRVCKKYKLVYYADSGTLIGAIRHQGYIPWDDDIDIVMLRKDYDKLIEVADAEFNFPFFLQTAYSEKNYLRGHAQMRNCETTGCILADVNTTYNKGIFIDIFPLDSIPSDKHERDKFIKQVNFIWNVLVRVRPLYTHIKLINFERLFRYYEKVCAKYLNQDTGYVSYIAYSRGKEKHIWKREWFSKYHDVPFEFTDIMVPNGYDERLKKEYGDYMVIKKAQTSHGDVILQPDIPYKEYFKKN
jgi:lipopolysaccharide cholinephosphotransferase